MSEEEEDDEGVFLHASAPKGARRGAGELGRKLLYEPTPASGVPQRAPGPSKSDSG